MVDVEAAHSWDIEYATGRYEGEPPVPFVHDIVVAAKDAQVGAGLYVGCGKTRIAVENLFIRPACSQQINH